MWHWCLSKENSEGDSNRLNDKTEEHIITTDSVVDSESRGNDFVQSNWLRENETTDESYVQNKGKDTDEDNEEELNMTGDNTNNDNDGKKYQERWDWSRQFWRAW